MSKDRIQGSFKLSLSLLRHFFKSLSLSVNYVFPLVMPAIR